MQYFNHYSAPILAAVLLAGGLSLVSRRGGKMRQWLVLGEAMVALGVAWWMFRPVATPATTVAGLPWLLEVQSPYCLGWVAIKPAVDRLERGQILDWATRTGLLAAPDSILDLPPWHYGITFRRSAAEVCG